MSTATLGHLYLFGDMDNGAILVYAFPTDINAKPILRAIFVQARAEYRD